MVTCQSSELGWEVTVEFPADFLSLGRGSVICTRNWLHDFKEVGLSGKNSLLLELFFTYNLENKHCSFMNCKCVGSRGFYCLRNIKILLLMMILSPLRMLFRFMI